MKEYQDVIEQLKKQNPQALIVFGSHAWGTPHKDSDLDVLVIKESPKSRIERIREARANIKTNKPVDILHLTPQEAQSYKKKSTFYKQIFDEGKLVYGRL